MQPSTIAWDQVARVRDYLIAEKAHAEAKGREPQEIAQ